jgi:hypothetical protein
MSFSDTLAVIEVVLVFAAEVVLLTRNVNGAASGVHSRAAAALT